VYQHSSLDKDDPESAGFICPLVGFDLEKFPIIAWSRKNGINLVNLNKLSSEPLIERKIATIA